MVRAPVALVVLLLASSAAAETHVTVPAGGAAPAFDVRVDLAKGVVVAGGAVVPIGLDHARLPTEKDVVTEVVPIGGGKQVVHVRVPATDVDGVAWEAVLAPGRGAPLFAGVTGFVQGDPGERTGKGLKIVPGSGASFVVVGDVREDLRICGQDATLFDPEALYPSTLTFHPATVQRLPDAARDLASGPLDPDHRLVPR